MNISFNNITIISPYSQTHPKQRQREVYFHGLENSPQKDTVKFSSSPKEKEWSLIGYIKSLFADKLSEREKEFQEKLQFEKLESGEQRFSPRDTKKILQLYRKNPDFIEMCVGEREYDSPRFNTEEIIELNKLAKQSPNIVKTIIEKVDYYHKPTYSYDDIKDIANCKNIPEDKMIALINNYTKTSLILFLSKKKNFDKIYNLLDEGLQLIYAISNAEDSESRYQEVMNTLKTNPNSMRDLLNSPDFYNKLQQNSAGKYQKEFMNIFENINFDMKRNLIDSGLSGEDFLNATKKLSKSTFKLAYDTPNQYLSDINTKFTTPVNGKLPELSSDELKHQRKCIVRFFQNNIRPLTRALKYIDTDTLNHMMDKRTDTFQEELDNLNVLSHKNYELLSQLLKCKSQETGKKLSPREKIKICHIIEIFQDARTDTSCLKRAAKTGVLDFNIINEIIMNKIPSLVGIDPGDKTIPKNKKSFNQDYMALIFMQDDDKNLQEVIRVSLKDDFNIFIEDPSNEFGIVNRKTKKTFKYNGLNYKKWMHPDIEEKFNLKNRDMTIKLWDRYPQEDLFIGNKTTCCTAIGTGSNREATPIYMLNTAFNVAELYDNKKNVIGMSRVFMANINNKPALIMDNIELNNTFVKHLNDDEQKQLRNKFFKYMHRYAEMVGGKNTPVYFCSIDSNVPTDDLTDMDASADFIGDVSEEVYINSLGTWINPKDLKDNEITWLEVPNQVET